MERTCRLKEKPMPLFSTNTKLCWFALLGKCLIIKLNAFLRLVIHPLYRSVDYQTVRKKVQASNIAGYVMAKDYYLTVPCMEFFITCKVRPVFEM